MNKKYLWVKRISEEPAIFIQDRVGIEDQIFKMYKFRTMVKNAEDWKYKYLHLNEAKQPLFKIKDDPRLSRIGNFLRNIKLGIASAF